MKDKIYGIAFAVALFSLLAISLGSGVGSAYTYKDTGEGNGFEWSANGSTCTVKQTDSGSFYLDVDFSPGTDGGAYAAGGMGFIMEKETYDNGEWSQWIKEGISMTQGYTEDDEGTLKSVYYDILKNEHEGKSVDQNDRTYTRTDHFDYKIQQTVISIISPDPIYNYKQGTYHTTYQYDVGTGPI